MILVTGGAGFIGSHLVRSALRKSHEVIVLDKASKSSVFPSSSFLTYRRGDLNRVERLFPSQKLHDLMIVHLAAETSVKTSIIKPFSTIRTNVRGTCAVLEFARKSDAQRFVFASSAAIYGDRRGPCHEDDSPEPRSPYAASKLAGEYYCKMYSRLYGIPVVILRYFNVYGPGQSSQYAGVITHFLRSASRGRPPTIFGDGKQTRDFIFVEDVVQATLNCLNKNLPSGITLNIGSGRALDIRELALKIIRMLGREDLHPTYVPVRQGDVRFSVANISRARRRIGLRPEYDIDSGLKLTMSWVSETSSSGGKASRP